MGDDIIPPKRQRRVKNAAKIWIDGIRWDSETEAYYYTLLKAQKESGEIQSFEKQHRYDLQPQYRKCQKPGCDFLWVRPDEKSPDMKRYKNARKCPLCGHNLELIREMYYVSDFDVVDNSGLLHVIDVKASPFFQTEIFHMKRRIFELKYPHLFIEMVFPKPPKGWAKIIRATEPQGEENG